MEKYLNGPDDLDPEPETDDSWDDTPTREQGNDEPKYDEE